MSNGKRLLQSIRQEVKTELLALQGLRAGEVPADFTSGIRELHDSLRQLDLPAGRPPELDPANITEVIAHLDAVRKWLDDQIGQTQPAVTDPPPSEEDRKLTRRERRAQWLAEAMLLVQDHPDWPDRQIAEAVKISPSQLTRSREYQSAAGLSRGQRTDLPKGHLTDQGVEAYQPEE